MKSVGDDVEWDDVLRDVVFAYVTSMHSCTGHTPLHVLNVCKVSFSSTEKDNFNRVL